MAKKRMFHQDIVQSDAFMDMPQSSQLLYFHLCMEADDEGFIGNAKRVMRGVGSSDDDYKILIAKRFILVFPEGVCVIKHWLIHNYISSDRFHETKYLDQKKLLSIKDNKAYTDREIGGDIKQISAGEKKEKMEYPEWLNIEAWDKWLQYKKERKEKMPKTTIDSQIKRLERLGKENHIAIIEQAIEKGWRSFFPLSDDGRTAKKETHDL